MRLATAWLEAELHLSLAGAIGEKDKPIAPLLHRAPERDARRRRHLVLGVLAEVAPGAAAPPAAVRDRAQWDQPGGVGRRAGGAGHARVLDAHRGRDARRLRPRVPLHRGPGAPRPARRTTAVGGAGCARPAGRGRVRHPGRPHRGHRRRAGAGGAGRARPHGRRRVEGGGDGLPVQRAVPAPGLRQRPLGRRHPPVPGGPRHPGRPPAAGVPGQRPGPAVRQRAGGGGHHLPPQRRPGPAGRGGWRPGPRPSCGCGRSPPRCSSPMSTPATVTSTLQAAGYLPARETADGGLLLAAPAAHRLGPTRFPPRKPAPAPDIPTLVAALRRAPVASEPPPAPAPAPAPRPPTQPARHAAGRPTSSRPPARCARCWSRPATSTGWSGWAT